MEKETFDKLIFDPAFPLDGPHLVEASAGTGKTHNIQNIYARLIMERGLKVSEIQVMTFTDAATKELHDRLHAVLKDLQCRFSGQSCEGKKKKEIDDRNKRAEALVECVCETDFFTPLSDDRESRKTLAKNRVELALLEFDNAVISTIHGFCRRVLDRYAFDIGVDLASVIENNKPAELNALAENWWRTNPEDRAGLTLGTLKKYILKLSQKNEYGIAKPDGCKKNKKKLLETADAIVTQYNKDILNRENMNYDDLLLSLRDALKSDSPRSGDLIAKLRKEFKAALIDEFQDTDPVQYEIFEKIFLDDNENPLFFVGDPKQAIYCFRGGDIYTYFRAKDAVGSKVSSLNVNRRSTSRMVAAVNAMFKDSDSAYTFGDERSAYEESQCPDDEPEIIWPEGKQTPLEIVTVTFPEKTDSKQKSSMVMNAAVEKILQLLRHYSPKDIAVLTLTNETNSDLQKLLRTKNVPSVIRKAGNVFSSPVAMELWVFLSSVADSSNKRNLLAALHTVFGGCPFEELPSLEDADALEGSLKRFAEMNQLWRTNGLDALIAQLEADGYRERLAQRPDGMRLLADIDQIWKLSRATVKKIGPSIEAFLVWLTDRLNGATGNSYGNADDNSEVDSEEYARELESDEDAIAIMTIHQSKGLQFPVVVLTSCWKTKTAQEDPITYHDDEEKLIFSVDACDDLKTKAMQEQEQENKRLIYVAMTRAKERTIVITPPQEQLVTKNRKGEETGRKPLYDLIEKLKANSEQPPPFQIVTAPELTIDKYIRPQKNGTPLAIMEPPEIRTCIFKGSYSSLFPSEHGDDSEDGRDVDPWCGIADSEEERKEREPIFRVPEGNITGTCWHNILEKVPFDADGSGIGDIAKPELSRFGLMPSEEQKKLEENYFSSTVNMIDAVLNFTLTSPLGETFALNRVPWERRLSEQEFDFSTARAEHSTAAIRDVLEKHWKDDPEKAEFLAAMKNWDCLIPRGYMTGFIDLIFQHGDYFYVVDWKSNSLEKNRESFCKERVRKEMAKHGYFFQYLLYAVVLHNYLKKTIEGYSWKKNFGGIRYYFLRGVALGGTAAEAAVFSDRPSEALLEDLGKILGLEA